MYLKRLELNGFKSFNEKTKLDFNKGITAVVGPNGSGKSNIADAVRWVLGEQSAKSLRGQKMEDVIFAGTQNRRPLGFAEVSMIIDNTDGKMPTDYSEIKITRKVFRSGESDYQINGVSCRLKDIHELFADTGVGKEGYSIIGQGRIEEILSSRSEDRRYLFEEAAGIIKYKNRKAETESRLAKEKQNLLRVNDILDVLFEQIEPLKEQSEKAFVYLDLKERLKVSEINLFLLESSFFEEEIKNISTNIETINEQILTEENKHENIKQSVENLKEEASITDLKIKDNLDKLSSVRNEVSLKENSLGVLNERISNFNNEILRIENEILKVEEIIKINLFKKENQYILKNQLIKEMEEKNKELVNLESDFENLKETMSDSEEKIDYFNTSVMSKVKLITETKAEISRISGYYEELENKKEQLGESLVNEVNRKKQAEDFIEEFRVKLNSIEEETVKIREEQNKFENDKKIYTDNFNKIDKQNKETSKKLNEAKTKYKMLLELENNFEGYSRSVKSILIKKRENPSLFSGVFGTVSDILSTEKQYETAINIALGFSLQNIVTKTEKEAQEVIEILKREKSGRATFMPLTTMKPSEFNESQNNILKENGVISTAKNLVKYDTQFENIFSNLLGRVLIVDNFENAVKLSKKYNSSYKMVTIQGELFQAGGSITGGAVFKDSSSIFTRKREIEHLKVEIDKLEVLQKQELEEIESLEKSLSIINFKLNTFNEALHEKAIERVRASESVNKYENILTDCNSALFNIEEDDRKIMEEIVASNKKNRELENLLILYEKEMTDEQEQLSKLKVNVFSGKQVKDEHFNVLTDLKVSIGQIEQHLKAVEGEISRFLEDTEAKKITVLNLLDDIKLKKEEIEKNANVSNGLDKEILDLKEKEKEVLSTLAVLDDCKDDYKERIEKQSVLEEECKNTIFSLKNEQSRLTYKSENIENERRKSYDDLWNDYKMTLRDALSYKKDDLSKDSLKKQCGVIKNKIEELGYVNVNSIEEYKVVKQKYEQINEQKLDILEAENKLLKLIEELTTLMEQKFKTQFELISQNFSKVFKEMFNGGDAFLKLSDEINVLEAGIEIVAKPPGKNLQNMSLLSGGERALTATALLFGILLLKPSPFCIFDEVEAALDDSNISRFTSFIKNFVNDTQFIIITHRKQTMEAADCLYGITMQEQGISTLVSVSFEEN